jgi:hypothetical protein
VERACSSATAALNLNDPKLTTLLVGSNLALLRVAVSRSPVLVGVSQARREVELTNVPVVVAQAERFRSRLGFWESAYKRLDSVVAVGTS